MFYSQLKNKLCFYKISKTTNFSRLLAVRQIQNLPKTLNKLPTYKEFPELFRSTINAYPTKRVAKKPQIEGRSNKNVHVTEEAWRFLVSRL